MKKKRLGIAFGGGAARGIAHIGVVKVLEEEHIGADVVAGTSVGSLIGALYCAGFSWKEMLDITLGFKWQDLVSVKFGKMGLFIPDKLEESLNEVLGGKTFAELKIPFKAAAVNVQNAQQVVLDSGNVAQAVLASSSVPGVFLPKKIDDMLLIDGGMRNSVPGDVVKAMGADIVIGINLNADKTKPRKVKNFLQVIKNTMRMIVANNMYAGLPFIDVLVEPDLTEFSYGDLKHKRELCSRGEAAMTAALPALRALLEEETIHGK